MFRGNKYYKIPQNVKAIDFLTHRRSILDVAPRGNSTNRDFACSNNETAAKFGIDH